MPLPNNQKNDKYQRLERRQRVATLYLQGRTQWDIARQLGCSQGTICNDLVRIKDQWLASSLRDFEAAKAQELAKLDRVEAAVWEALERSQQPLTKKGDKRPGDPRFLAQVFQCIEARLKILGVLKGQTVNLNQAQVGVTQVPWDELFRSVPKEVPDLIEEEILKAQRVMEAEVSKAQMAPDPSTNGRLGNGANGK
jgi:hypothetical protein